VREGGCRADEQRNGERYCGETGMGFCEKPAHSGARTGFDTHFAFYRATTSGPFAVCRTLNGGSLRRLVAGRLEAA
jgi:hypothetical protein